MLPQKTRNFIKIKNISGVEKYVPGLKPSNFPEKGKEIEKSSENFLGHINTLKHLLLKHQTKNHQEKKMIQDFLHPQVLK